MTLTVPHVHKLWSQTVTGYRVNGLWNVVVPVGADVTNLCTNPSFETNTTMWSATGGATIVRTATRQRRGAFSLQITPGAGAFDGAFCSATSVIGRQRYTWSVDFLGQAGQQYRIYVANTTGNAQSQFKVFTATGLWQRVSISYQDMFTAGVTVARRLYVTKNGGANTGVFYIDGSAFYNLPYEITWFDGDSRGFSPTATEFWWNGTPHGSTSTMSGKTRACGRKIPLTQFGFTVLTMLGLGMEPINLISSPLAQRGGEQFIDAVPDARVFDLIGAFNARSLPQLQRQRQQMIDVFKVDSTPYAQPLALRYTPVDDRGRQVGVEQEIVASYQSGLEGKLDNHYQENVDLRFKVYLPFVGNDDQSEGAALGVQTALGNANYILKRSAGGIWSELQTGLNSSVETILPLPDGTWAVGGNFTNAGGIADADYLARYTPSTNLFSAFNATPLNSGVNVLKLMPNGNVLVGGFFTDAGGGASADFLCQLNLTTGAYTAFGVTPLSAVVRAAEMLSNGDWALGGDFLNAGDANGDYLCRMNRTTFVFSSFNATPLNNSVLALKLDKANNLIVGGTFINAGGDVDASYVTRVNSTTGAFEVLVQTATPSGPVEDLEVGDDGILYIGGFYSNWAGDANMDGIVRFNGAAYLPLMTGVSPAGPADGVYTLKKLEGGSILLGGTFTQAGGLTLYDRLAIWNLSSFVPFDIDLPGSATIMAIATRQDELMIGFNTAGIAAVSTITTLTNTGTVKAYPRITLTGPGTVFQFKNWTTGKSIWFNLTLIAGETAVFDFSNPTNVSFTSNLRGNILGTILPGSDLDFFLLPGANNVSLFIAGTVNANTAASLYWRKAQHSIDSAIPVP